jgi:light-regulated signal transduction histidine kinase (bacteriophytochrome)
LNDPDLTRCDREPIHVPGAIQPHGVLLIIDVDGFSVAAVAGDVEGRLGVARWEGAALRDLVGEAIARQAADMAEARPPLAYLGRLVTCGGVPFDVSAHWAGERMVLELEPAPEALTSPGILMGGIEAAAVAFERAPSFEALCELAAAEFRRLTGYDRVMVYRFLDDDAGAVVAEDKRDDLHSFANHRFPASDIPRQARELYLRNLIRVIPDVDYQPAPVRSARVDLGELDMTDAVLRSVSPIHLQYLRNMKVAASASISIVKDGVLWGLIACHNETPRTIPYDVRSACRALGGALGRHIRARDETEAFRERIRLRSFEDDLVEWLSREGTLDDAVSNHVEETRRAFGGDGVAAFRGRDLIINGHCPDETQIRALAQWLLSRPAETLFSTDRLIEHYPAAAPFVEVASGLLAMTLSASEPWVVMWFRAEQVEVVNWAGNPHKNVDLGPGETLSPRRSFEAWRETVRGRSRRWTVPEIEAAARLRAAVVDVWRSRRLRELNGRLLDSIREKDLLIQQKEFLIGEVNHRVQNSLQLVSSFLALQSRASDQPGLGPALDEARRRLSAVALVHRRLYRSDQVEAVDAARYIEELAEDIVSSLGPDWKKHLTLNLSPVILPPDRAIGLGLVLTELVINANKYAYDGKAGPIEVALSEDRADFRLVVADRGRGKAPAARRGFGSRMMEALVAQLGGSQMQEDNRPGLRVVLKAPIVRDLRQPAAAMAT